MWELNSIPAWGLSCSFSWDYSLGIGKYYRLYLSYSSFFTYGHVLRIFSPWNTVLCLIMLIISVFSFTGSLSMYYGFQFGVSIVFLCEHMCFMSIWASCVLLWLWFFCTSLITLFIIYFIALNYYSSDACLFSNNSCKF